MNHVEGFADEPLVEARGASGHRSRVEPLLHRAQRAEVRVDEARIEAPGAELRRVAEPLEKGEIGLRPGNRRLPERVGELVERLVARRAVTPVSMRIASPSGKRRAQSLPVEGRKPFSGSSA
jgi:hypothetical protein